MMELTNEQFDNVVGHIQSAQILMPYRAMLEAMEKDIDIFKPMLDMPYEEAVANNSEYKTIKPDVYAFVQDFARVFNDPEMIRAYLAMMDILEGNILIEPSSPGGTLFFVPKGNLNQLGGLGVTGGMFND